jgi:hypothetical protein
MCNKIFVITIAILLIPTSLYAAGMSGSNFKILFDSLNAGGGNSVSSSYGQESTFGEIATGESGSANYRVKAGYQQMNESFISITSSPDITLPTMSGIGGGVSTSSAQWTVLTDNPAGYSLSIRASTSPALKAQSGAYFADYSPAGSDPDFVFSINPSTSAFGFSPEGSHIIQIYKDNGSVCNAGSLDTADRCWDSFSTIDKIISQSATANHPSGTMTTVKLRAESGSSHIQDSGTYTAELTVTAVTL